MPPVRRLISGVGLLVSLVIAVAVPAGYYGLGSADVAASLDFKARLSASRVGTFIFAHDRLWQYQQVRLSELIEFPVDNQETVRQRITDLKSKVVLQEAGDLATPLRTVRVPIIVGGEVVAWLDADASLWALLVSTAWVAAFSCALGPAAWLAMRILLRMGSVKNLGQRTCLSCADRPG